MHHKKVNERNYEGIDHDDGNDNNNTYRNSNSNKNNNYDDDDDNDDHNRFQYGNCTKSKMATFTSTL